MSDDKLLDNLVERVARHMTVWPAELREDLAVGLALRAREAYGRGVEDAYADNPENESEAYPLPDRTRKVLREEPDPDGGAGMRFRCKDGKLEAQEDGQWFKMWSSHQIGFNISPGRVRLWVDLLDNPYRTETVPRDPDDPWGES